MQQETVLSFVFTQLFFHSVTMCAVYTVCLFCDHKGIRLSCANVYIIFMQT